MPLTSLRFLLVGGGGLSCNFVPVRPIRRLPAPTYKSHTSHLRRPLPWRPRLRHRKPAETWIEPPETWISLQLNQLHPYRNGWSFLRCKRASGALFQCTDCSVPVISESPSAPSPSTPTPTPTRMIHHTGHSRAQSSPVQPRPCASQAAASEVGERE